MLSGPTISEHILTDPGVQASALDVPSIGMFYNNI